MRLIMNFNRLCFESFGFDSYDRADILSEGPEQVSILLSDSDGSKAFAPCNEGSNSTEGERERYKIRWNEDEVEESGLIGSARYSVDSEPGDPSILHLNLHSYIVAGQPESFEEPVASVSYTEVNGRTEAERKANFEKAVREVLLGGDSKVIMNTLRMNLFGRYKTDTCWLKGGNQTSVCHIRPWSTGENVDMQRDLLLDEENVWLLRPDLQVRFAKGDFSVKDNGELVFAKGVDPVAECGFSQAAIDLGRTPRVLFNKLGLDALTPGMREFFRWHRKNVFRG